MIFVAGLQTSASIDFCSFAIISPTPPFSRVMVSDLVNWESKHGPIPRGAIVVMYSGWGKYVNDTPAYLGIPRERFERDPNDFSDMHHPGFSGEAAKWLVENR